MKKSIILCAAAVLLCNTDINAQQPTAATLAGLEFRDIGPAAVGGRVSDIAIDPSNRNVWYVSTASGGLFKTTNAGTTWRALFDDAASYSIGVVEVDPRNPRTIWVGTGENTGQRSVAFGDGVYKSTDGGDTWRRVGLENSEHIGVITFDPRDSNVVWVAAQGPLWAPGGDRGLYVTRDGGATWTRALHVSENTGISDVVIDPRNPDVMYAASYQRRRHMGMQIAGGPEGAVYKSTDGGRTWNKIMRGMPTVDIGRIGIALSPQNPDIVYALVAAQDSAGGFFKSADRGETWTRQSNFVPTDPQYYMELYPDPRVAGRIYTLDVPFRITNDEGRTWGSVPGQGVHVDHHAVAFDPVDANIMLLGNDGGLYQTFDGGQTWRWFQNLPAAQFYRIDVDDAQPFYNVYGGLQDNGSLMGPSRTLQGGGILNHHWTSIGGGDGMQPRAEPGGRYVYTQSQNGSLSRLDMLTGENVSIRPRQVQGQPAQRWTWDAPLIISPHRPTRIYFGSQQLWRSDDRGNTWAAVSGDLTRNLNRDTMQIMGRRWPTNAVGRNLFTHELSTIVIIEESPMREGLLFVGTDDGQIQISENGGQSWRVSRIPGVPDLAVINDIAASRHDPNVLYAVAHNFQRGDFRPYVYRSGDLGRTWTQITAGIPERHVTWTIVEDHVNRDLLFLGTEFGVFTSLNGGRGWTQLTAGIPTIMVRDLAIQRRENDLLAGTFGRGIFILDDYAPLRALTPQVLAGEGTLLPVRDALQFNSMRGAPGSGQGNFAGENGASGALLTYYLRDRASAGLVINITNAAGEHVADVPAAANAGGVQRTVWNLRPSARFTAQPVAAGGQARGGQGGGPGGGQGGGQPVPPGTYTATLGRRSGDTFTPVGTPQRFSVKPLHPPEVVR